MFTVYVCVFFHSHGLCNLYEGMLSLFNSSVCLLCTVCLRVSPIVLDSRELHEADFYKAGVYGSVQVWANPCDLGLRCRLTGCCGFGSVFCGGV